MSEIGDQTMKLHEHNTQYLEGKAPKRANALQSTPRSNDAANAKGVDLNLPVINSDDNKLTRLEKERLCDTYGYNIFRNGDLKKEVQEEFCENTGKRRAEAQQTSISEVVG